MMNIKESFGSGMKNMSAEHYIFIYGSLKQGYHNEHWMGGAILLQDTVTAEMAYEMHACTGMFPMVVPGDKRISGELYVINNNKLDNLDKLEDNGRSYTRKKIKLSGVDVLAWMYMYNYPDNIPPSEGLEFLVSTEDSIQTWLKPEDYFEFGSGK